MGFLQTFKHLLPRSQAWRLASGSQIRQFFEGLATQPDAIRTWLDLLWLDIFPETTREIAKWEAHFGVVPNSGDSDATRRERLESEWAARGGQDPAYIQALLQAAGFDLYVHDWWSSALPYVVRDPRDFTSQPLIGTAQCSGLASQPQCSAGGVGSDDLPRTQWQCNDFLVNEIRYLVNQNLTRRAPPRVPDDPRRWPQFVYVGPETLTSSAFAPVERERRAELERLLLKVCPAEKWIVVRAIYDTLEELGTFVGEWRADWPGNTISGTDFVTLQNVYTPGTKDFQWSNSYPQYEATGWGGTLPAARCLIGDHFTTTGVGGIFGGNNSHTVALAIQWNTKNQDPPFRVYGDGDYCGITLNTGSKLWAMWRNNSGTTKWATSAVTPSGREVILATFNGTTKTGTMWRNNTKIIDAVDLDVGALSAGVSTCELGPGAAGTDFRYGLIAVWSSLFTDEQAETAFNIINASYPIS